MRHYDKFGIKIARNQSAIQKITFLVNILESTLTPIGHV